MLLYDIDSEFNLRKSRYKANFIKAKNKSNFIISFDLFFVFVIYNSLEIINANNLSHIFILLVLIRIVSRLLEINFAFYDDSIDRRVK